MLKLLKNIEIDESKYKNLLLSGDLYGFEESLYKFILTEVYAKLATHLINSVVASEAFEQKISCLASSQRGGYILLTYQFVFIITEGFVPMPDHLIT